VPTSVSSIAKEGIVFVMMGIVPYKATHTAVAVDGDEYVVDEFTLRFSNDRVERLTGWSDRFAKREWAVESASGLGYLISQQLVACGETVFDVPAVLASRVTLMASGRSHKNDPNDACSIAIAALRSRRVGVVEPDDHVVVLCLLVKRHRDMARLRNEHCGRLHASSAYSPHAASGKDQCYQRIRSIRLQSVLVLIDVDHIWVDIQDVPQPEPL
jgi:hypothetical protein